MLSSGENLFAVGPPVGYQWQPQPVTAKQSVTVAHQWATSGKINQSFKCKPKNWVLDFIQTYAKVLHDTEEPAGDFHTDLYIFS